MTDPDNKMKPLHFGSDPADNRIWIKPEILTRIPNHFDWDIGLSGGLRSLSTIYSWCLYPFIKVCCYSVRGQISRLAAVQPIVVKVCTTVVLSKMVSVIFAVVEVSFWALTTVVKLPWKLLTLILRNELKNQSWPCLIWHTLYLSDIRCKWFPYRRCHGKHITLLKRTMNERTNESVVRCIIVSWMKIKDLLNV